MLSTIDDRDRPRVARNFDEWLAHATVLHAEVIRATRALADRITVLPEGGIVTAPALEARAMKQAVSNLDEWIRSAVEILPVVVPLRDWLLPTGVVTKTG